MIILHISTWFGVQKLDFLQIFEEWFEGENCVKHQINKTVFYLFFIMSISTNVLEKQVQEVKPYFLKFQKNLEKSPNLNYFCVANRLK
jgi:hypothetical protein